MSFAGDDGKCLRNRDSGNRKAMYGIWKQWGEGRGMLANRDMITLTFMIVIVIIILTACQRRVSEQPPSAVALARKR